VAGLAAAAGFAFLLSSPGGPGENAGITTRVKGSARIGFFVKHGDELRRGSDGQVVHPGDQLRFTVTSKTARHFAILSLDGASVASVYYPSDTTSAPIAPGRDHALSSSVLLDETLGEEKIWGIFCDAPFALEPLRSELEQRGKLPALPGCSIDELSVVKEAAP